MTYDELKNIADSMGYRLVKKKPYIPHGRCICGSRGSVWFTGHKRFIRCDDLECKFTGPITKTEREAWIEWNNTVRVFNAIFEALSDTNSIQQGDYAKYGCYYNDNYSKFIYISGLYLEKTIGVSREWLINNKDILNRNIINNRTIMGEVQYVYAENDDDERYPIDVFLCAMYIKDIDQLKANA